MSISTFVAAGLLGKAVGYTLFYAALIYLPLHVAWRGIDRLREASNRRKLEAARGRKLRASLSHSVIR